MSSNFSIYIPRIACFHDENFIRRIMETYRIGKVSHVDFVPINKKPGFYENINVTDTVRSVFVHFAQPTITEVYQMQSLSHSNFWNVVAKNQPYKLVISLSEFWMCLKTHYPAQRTMMNISQVVDNCRYLEDCLENQNSYIKKLDKKFDELYQMVCKLSTKNKDLETTIDNMLDFKDDVYEEDIDSISCQMSVCSDAHSSMPELEDSLTGKRIRNSCDLCGNE